VKAPQRGLTVLMCTRLLPQVPTCDALSSRESVGGVLHVKPQWMV